MKALAKGISILGLIAMLIGLNACVSINDLKIGQIKDVQVGSLNGNQIDAALTLPIENPNCLGVKVNSANLLVLVGDKTIGKVTQVEPLVFPAKSNSSYTVKAKVEFTSSIATMFSAFSLFSGKKPEIRIKGTLNASSFIFSRKIEVDQIIPLKL